MEMEDFNLRMIKLFRTQSLASAIPEQPSVSSQTFDD